MQNASTTDDRHVIVADGWAAIPEALLYAPEIPAEAVRVYGVLHRHGTDPANCYPSHARIARLIGKSARSVPSWIRDLEDAGWLDRIPRVGPDGAPTSNAYRIHGRAVERGVRADERGPLPADERGPSTPESAPNESHGNESQVEREQEQGALVRQLPDPFEEFWRVYPRKVGKPTAVKAWKRALHRASAERIIEGATAYAKSREGQDPQFTKHPGPWLNDDRWDVEYDQGPRLQQSTLAARSWAERKAAEA